ncbi:MAG: hypothetical protein QOI21_3390 [Actinomycetota bacterium]|nr:hypothetical protein [Actinomycetota bacterium]
MRSRELGGELRRVREKAKLSGHSLARMLGWPAPKISRLETGKREVSEVDVAIFLARCGAPPEELERLMQLARSTDSDYRSQLHGERLPDRLRSLVMLETTAETILAFEPTVIPGLLQTEAYVRELLRWGGCKPGRNFELLVNARLARHSIFNRRWPPEMVFFVHEQALVSVIGDSELMYEQFLHLLLVTSAPKCEVRIIPASQTPVGVFGGSFRLMRFEADRPVAYAESHAASLFLEEERDIKMYEELLDKVAARALNGGQSREWLASLASEHERVETTRDDSSRTGLA